jgi:hypothetical protein
VTEAACHFCGCTEDRACPGGCAWVPSALPIDVCDACAPTVSGKGFPVVRVAPPAELAGAGELRDAEVRDVDLERRPHLAKVVYISSRTAAWIAKSRVVTEAITA